METSLLKARQRQLLMRELTNLERDSKERSKEEKRLRKMHRKPKK